MVHVLYVSDGLIFADSTGLVLDIPRSQGTLGKICGDGQTIGSICLPTLVVRVLVSSALEVHSFVFR
jgi:hypothetical protein